MINDPLCIKEDVCEMADCAGAIHCSHAVLKSAVLAQRSNNSAIDALALLVPQYTKQFKLEYSICADITEFLIWARQQHQ